MRYASSRVHTRHCCWRITGPIVSGASLEAAVYATEELEETAKLFLLLRNVPIRALTDSQIDELRSVIPVRK